MKKVKQLLFGNMVDMGGIPVRQPLPTLSVEQLDPFLLLHHFVGEVKSGTDYRHSGIGPHPHRGFSPVTFVFQGSVHHRDSRGNEGVVEAGGVQWMNAGMGIIHSERPGADLAKEGGTQEIIQLWVNTPAIRKMDQPYYLAVEKSEMPVFKPEKGQGEIQLVSGNFNGKTGIVNSTVPLLSLMGVLNINSEYHFKLPNDQAALLYLLGGQVHIEGYGIVEEHNLVVFEEEGSIINIKANTDTKFLLLSAKPINEPMTNYGPFVMNSQTEIMQAMRDYQMGKMGVLIEEFD